MNDISGWAEAQYRDELAAQIGGTIEVRLDFGRCDIMHDAHGVFEVEPYQGWRHGVQQALAYSALADVTGNIAIYGVPSGEKAAVIFDVLRKSTKLQLWLRNETGEWVHVVDRRAALRDWDGQRERRVKEQPPIVQRRAVPEAVSEDEVRRQAERHFADTLGRVAAQVASRIAGTR